MRELTMAEIEQFDFTGQVPDLHVHGSRETAAAETQVTYRLKSQASQKKRRFSFGKT